MIYFTSDLHFFNKRSPSKIGDKIFNSIVERNEFLVQRWNSVVSEQDDVYILGDFSDGKTEETLNIIKCLKGKKYLIIGNNDRYLNDTQFDTSVFEWYKSYYELIFNKQKYVLFHFPLEVWSGYGKDRIHLHGHMHRKKSIYEPIRRYEVGVDAHDGLPVSIEDITIKLEDLHNSNRKMMDSF